MKKFQGKFREQVQKQGQRGATLDNQLPIAGECQVD